VGRAARLRRSGWSSAAGWSLVACRACSWSSRMRMTGIRFAMFSGDWTPLHTDVETAKAGPFGERIPHGMLVLSAVTGLVELPDIGARVRGATSPSASGRTSRAAVAGGTPGRSLPPSRARLPDSRCRA
jgi:hypothetical protein